MKDTLSGTIVKANKTTINEHEEDTGYLSFDALYRFFIKNYSKKDELQQYDNMEIIILDNNYKNEDTEFKSEATQLNAHEKANKQSEKLRNRKLLLDKFREIRNKKRIKKIR